MESPEFVLLHTAMGESLTDVEKIRIEVPKRIFADVNAYTGEVPRFDDITMVVLSVKGFCEKKFSSVRV